MTSSVHCARSSTNVTGFELAGTVVGDGACPSAGRLPGGVHESLIAAGRTTILRRASAAWPGCAAPRSP